MRPRKDASPLTVETDDETSAHPDTPDFAGLDAKICQLFTGWHGKPTDAADPEWESMQPEGTEA